MTSDLGGRPEQMKAMSDEFSRRGTEVRDIINALNNRASQVGTDWRGQDAEKFRNSWEEYKGGFSKVADALDEASGYINTRLQQLQQWAGQG